MSLRRSCRIIHFDNISILLTLKEIFEFLLAHVHFNALLHVQLTDETQDIHKNECNHITQKNPKSNSPQFDEEIDFLNKFC